MIRQLLAAFALLISISSAHAAEPFTLMLEWFVNPNHGSIIIAKQQGYFKEVGLKVTIQEPADPSLPPKMVASNKVDAAVYYQPSLLLSVSEGLPLKWAGTLIGNSLDGLIVLENNGIDSLKDLKGKSIGVSLGGFETAVLDELFAPHGFSSKDVKLVNVGWNLSSSLMSKKVDAIMGAYRNFELNQLELEGKKGRMFFYETHGIPNYDELIFIANARTANDQQLKKFLSAIEKATAFIVANPEKSWEIFANYNPNTLNNALNRKAWFDTIAHFDAQPAFADKVRYQQFADFLQQHGQLKQPVDVDAILKTL